MSAGLTRRGFIAAMGAAVAGGLAGCSSSDSSPSPTTPPTSSTTKPVPLATSMAATTAPASTNLGQFPDVLQGLASLPGAQLLLDMEFEDAVFEFQDGGAEVIAQAILFAFAAQNPKYVESKDVDIGAYARDVVAGSLVTEVLLPRLAPGPLWEGDGMTFFPPVVAAAPTKADLSLPILISNGALGPTLGDVDLENALIFGPNRQTQARFGVTKRGQLFFCTFELGPSGVGRRLSTRGLTNFLSTMLGLTLAVTSHLAMTEATPTQQALAANYFINPWLVDPRWPDCPYPMLDALSFGTPIKDVGIIDKLFRRAGT